MSKASASHQILRRVKTNYVKGLIGGQKNMEAETHLALL